MEVAACREPSVLGRKRAMADTESAMKVLRQRFKSELVAVRGLCEKAKTIIKASPPPAIKRGKIEATSPPPVIKRRKIEASPPPEIKRRKVTQGEREELKADLEKLELSELPHGIRDLLQKHCHAVRDGGYFEFALQDDAILELRKQLDEFLREEHQERNNMVADEEDEDVDILGGVSPLPIAPAPLPLADEEDQYVDICGDATATPAKNLGDEETISGTPCSSSGSSDSTQAERDATLLMASAKESLARCTAREKARQDVLRTERAPKHMTTEAIDPTILQTLGIFEYDYHRRIPYTLLPRLGLFLKDDDEDLEEGEIPDDLEEGEIPDDLEEGEIRF